MRHFLSILAAATLLNACTMVVPTPVPQPDLTSCNAVGLEGLVGAHVSLVPTNGNWSSLRVIYPGQVVTMEYNPTRLTVRVDAAGIILSISCG